VLIVENDPEKVELDLAEGRFTCPSCSLGVLARWGSASLRELLDGQPFRPRRGICHTCVPQVTHVLLPDACLARRRYSAATIGAVLTASIGEGEPCEHVADRLGMSPETVRAWLRRFRRWAAVIRAHFTTWLLALKPGQAAPEPTGSLAADALEVIGDAARAAAVALETVRAPWAWASALTAGNLLANTSTPWPMPD